MRVRAMSSSGDMTFGSGEANFLVNSAAAVAQLLQTRMALWTGQWFLDLTEGTPYSTQILGKNTQTTYDNAIITRILETPNVNAITAYESNLNTATRALTWTATLDTTFGQTTAGATIVAP